jgi:hypothetical protein
MYNIVLRTDHLGMHSQGAANICKPSTQITNMDSKAASTHTCDQWLQNAFKVVMKFLDANKFLIGIILILACFRHESHSRTERLPSLSQLCTQHNLTRFAEQRDNDAMRKVADECRSSAIAVDARNALEYWDNEDWGRARNTRTVQAFQHYLRKWGEDGAHVAQANHAIRTLAIRRRMAAPPAADLDYCSQDSSGARREFFVQVFSSKTLDRAASARDVIARKYSAVIGSCGADVHSVKSRRDGELHRVLIGPVQTRYTAQSLCDELKHKGLMDCAAIQ